MKPLLGGVLAVTALVLAMGTFMQVLDSTIANVSLPTIAGNLGTSTNQGTWGSPPLPWPMASACR